ncbi:MAG: hypothetical protein JSR55_12415 [Proteobacteria bacterium]|nr:hypothetical protein [Pseudomonadota bacterium]
MYVVAFFAVSDVVFQLAAQVAIEPPFAGAAAIAEAGAAVVIVEVCVEAAPLPFMQPDMKALYVVAFLSVSLLVFQLAEHVFMVFCALLAAIAETFIANNPAAAEINNKRMMKSLQDVEGLDSLLAGTSRWLQPPPTFFWRRLLMAHQARVDAAY